MVASVLCCIHPDHDDPNASMYTVNRVRKSICQVKIGPCLRGRGMPELQIFVKCYLLLMHILLTLAKIRLAWFPNTSISLFVVKTLLLVTDQLDQKKHENVGKTENVDMLCVVGFTI